MLNSCSNRIWFVIELCEPVRITEIEVANFELFSNVPRQFRVYASERYLASSPTSNWQQKYLIGQFEAANSRSVQKFSIKDVKTNNNGADSSNGTPANGNTNNIADQTSNSTSTNEQPASNRQTAILMYAKYVRFEMMSHYGNEHYCPLSLVRIFGTSISDEEEAATPDSTETIIVDSSSSGSINIETTATTQAPTKIEDESKSDFLNRLVSEKDKLISNIIATFLGENFNLSKLFTLFSFQKATTETKENESEQIPASIPLVSLNPVNLDDRRRNQILQIDLHKVLCFSSIRNSSDCCQCLPEDINANQTRSSKGNGKRRKSRLLSTKFVNETTIWSKSNNWMSKYCGYYFLMMTSAQAQLNTSLLFKFLNNIIYSTSGGSEGRFNASGENMGNFTRFSLNNVNYYILNEWLDNQTAASFYFGSKTITLTNRSDDNSKLDDSSTSSRPSSGDQSNLAGVSRLDLWDYEG